MPSIPVRDGESLHVRILGRGQPVLMLPGLGMSSRQWLPFIWPFLHRFRFYLPDLRGFGLSANVRLNQADVFHNHMEDVQDLIRGLSLDDFLLAGISLGGTTALHLQREGGFGGVRRYLHIDQSPCIGNRADWQHGLFGVRQDELFGRMHRLRDLLAGHPDVDLLGDLPLPARKEAAAILADILALMTNRPLLAPVFRQLLVSPAQLARHLPLTRRADCQAYLGAYIGGGHDYRSSLRACPVPVTVMVGMRSPLYAPAGQMAIADYAPCATIVRMHGAGHVVPADAPVRFIRELGRFLEGGQR